MTESSGPPPDGYQNPYGAPPPAPGYQNPYQPSPPYGGYQPPQQPYSGYPSPHSGHRNGLGVASLVVAILAVVTVWSVAGGVILGLAAVVMGFIARGRVNRGEASNGGVAIAGIILGALAVIAGLAFIAIYMLFWKDIGGDDLVSCLQKAGSDPVAQQQCNDKFQQHVDNQFSITTTPSPAP
jgi:hypothetical protein